MPRLLMKYLHIHSTGAEAQPSTLRGRGGLQSRRRSYRQEAELQSKGLHVLHPARTGKSVGS